MKARATKILAVGWLLLITLSFASLSYSSGASANDFASANSAINSAFVATYDAQKNGGNVTALVNELNTAVTLVAKAQTENSTNPSQALSDLQNATQIAALVSSQSTSIGRAGQSAIQVRNSESVGSAIAVAVVAGLIYICGGRIYRRTWLYMYRNHVVKPSNG